MDILTLVRELEDVVCRRTGTSRAGCPAPTAPVPSSASRRGLLMPEGPGGSKRSKAVRKALSSIVLPVPSGDSTSSNISIRSGSSSAELSPQGAYAVGLSLDGTDLFKPTGDGKQQHGGAAVLIPYAGRIRKGRYTFEGKEYQFATEPDGDSLHGFGKDRRWQVEDNRADSVTFGALLKNRGYPGTLDTKVKYDIGPRVFSTGCTVTNVGRRAVPFVVGFHPYFLASEWRLSATGKVYRYELEDEFFPTGKKETFDFATIGAASHLDDEFRSAGTVKLETDRYTIVMKRYNMSYLVIFNGRQAEGKSVSIEPYTGLDDAFNNRIGLRVIEPGGSFKCGYDISLISPTKDRNQS